MSTAERRLDRVLPALTARERAVMFLHDFKAGVTVDPYASGPVPSSIDREFERLVDIIRFANAEVAEVVRIIREQVTQQELRFNWLKTMRQYVGELALLGEYLRTCVPHPITRSELRTRKGKAPEAGYDVRDDEDADHVALLRRNSEMAATLVDRGCMIALPIDLPADNPSGELTCDPDVPADVARVTTYIVRESLASYWTQLQAVEIVLAEYAEEFRGEEPLKPEVREGLADAQGRIVALREDALPYTGPWELPTDHERSLAAMRLLAERVLG